MIPLHCIIVTRRRRIATRVSLDRRRLQWWCGSCSTRDVCRTTAAVLWTPLAVLRDVVVSDSAAALGVGDRLVVARVGVAHDDPPGVDQAGQVAEAAEQDVDEAVAGAEAGFDPDCGESVSGSVCDSARSGRGDGVLTGDGWEEDGDEAEEDVCGRHVEGRRGLAVGVFGATVVEGGIEGIVVEAWWDLKRRLSGGEARER